MVSPLLLAAMVATVLVAVSCGGDDSIVPIDVSNGEELFELRALGGEPGCVTCHSLATDVVLVGPSLADPSASAAQAGYDDARVYVKTSIVDPTDHLVPGFDRAKQMPTAFAEILTPDQVDAVVDYLLGVDR